MLLNFADKYQSIIDNYNSLNTTISNFSSPEELKNASKELGTITPIAEVAVSLKNLIQEYNNLEEIINGDDVDLATMASEEIDTIKSKIDETTNSLETLLKKSDPNDGKDVILEIRAGTGGEEASLFAADLFRMYKRYSESKGWQLELLSYTESNNGGFKEVIAMVRGTNVYSYLKNESGVHRVQRVPATESSGRIHTSAASVVVLPEMEDVNIEVKNEDLRIDVFRAGGAGGQHVNKTESAVRITHIPTGIVVSCQDTKSQQQNKLKAMIVLKSKLFDLQQKESMEQNKNLRQSSIGSGDRSAKIKTYNFAENRLTDHRIKHTWYSLDIILEGNLDEVLSTTSTMLSDANDTSSESD